MKKILAVCAVMLLAVGLVSAIAVHPAAVLAAQAATTTDVTGTWTAQMQGPNGDMTLTFHFKQDGDKLTGTVETPMGDNPIDITNGKIDGDKIVFDTSFNSATIHHEGTVAADEIKLTAKPSDGSFPDMDLTLKRSK